MRPERHLLVKCPECGITEHSIVTVFSFSGRHPARFLCSCGHTKAVISTRDERLYMLQFPCPVCDMTHAVAMPAAKFWHEPMASCDCPDTQVEIGYIGQPDRIHHAMAMQQSLAELLPGGGTVDELFACPDIMYQVLSHLHGIANTGNLYCECGNDSIEVDLFPDKLELRCPTCNSISIIYAENEDDLTVMRRIEVIEMKRAGFTSVDASRFNPKHVRK